VACLTGHPFKTTSIHQLKFKIMSEKNPTKITWAQIINAIIQAAIAALTALGLSSCVNF
jgi:hypothetical protein